MHFNCTEYPACIDEGNYVNAWRQRITVWACTVIVALLLLGRWAGWLRRSNYDYLWSEANELILIHTTVYSDFEVCSKIYNPTQCKIRIFILVLIVDRIHHHLQRRKTEVYGGWIMTAKNGAFYMTVDRRMFTSKNPRAVLSCDKTESKQRKSKHDRTYFFEIPECDYTHSTNESSLINLWNAYLHAFSLQTSLWVLSVTTEGQP